MGNITAKLYSSWINWYYMLQYLRMSSMFYMYTSCYIYMHIYDIVLFFDIVYVIQRRENGYLDFFYLGWEKYKEGFGDLNREFWLGNDLIRALHQFRVCLYLNCWHIYTLQHLHLTVPVVCTRCAFWQYLPLQ